MGASLIISTVTARTGFAEIRFRCLLLDSHQAHQHMGIAAFHLHHDRNVIALTFTMKPQRVGYHESAIHQRVVERSHRTIAKTECRIAVPYL